jgi:hypothetical protein
VLTATSVQATSPAVAVSPGANGNLYAYALNAGNSSVYHREVRPPSIASLHPHKSLSVNTHHTFRSANEQ